jgi:CHAD domain-containing protein
MAHVLLRDLAERRLHALDTHLPAARDGDPAGVHQARVASRRLRELIPVLGAHLRAKRRRARRAVRRLTTALGTVRELDVTLGLLDTLAASDPELGPACAALRGGVQARREAEGRSLERVLASGVPRKASRRVAALFEDGGDEAAAAEVLSNRVARRADELRRAIEDVGLLFDDERLHQTRIAAKKLRYALEVAGEAGWARTAALVAALKRVQDVLGELHDRHVVMALVMRGQSEGRLPASGGEDHEAVERLVARLEQQRRALHAKYLRRRAALIGVTDAARDRVSVRLRARGAADQEKRAAAGGGPPHGA